MRRCVLMLVIVSAAVASPASASRPALTFTVTHGNRLYVCNRWLYAQGWIDRCVHVWAAKSTVA